jgi:L-ribulokinase
VLGREIAITETAQAPAASAAISAAVAAGLYPTLFAASAALSSHQAGIYTPDAEAHAVYTELYKEYMKLHDYFGKGGNEVMHRLRALSAKQKGDAHA